LGSYSAWAAIGFELGLAMATASAKQLGLEIGSSCCDCCRWHKPVLAQFFQHYAGKPLTAPDYAGDAIKCVDAAAKLIDAMTRDAGLL